jgi:CDGSH-type Zn-finger protein
MSDVKVTIRESGPYIVEGPILLIDADGNEYDLSARNNRVVLCRCGESSKKPFCDSTHRTCGFVASERANA